MITPHIQTKSLRLVPQTLEEVRAMIAAMTDAEKAELSADWLARVNNSTSADPWTHGFSFVRRDNDVVVGRGGFKGPPSKEGMVEIAYAVFPDHQGKGYATEAADALTAFAFSRAEVRMVRAHTLPEANASTRVLTKCGFLRFGEVADPEDGLVWRWEKHSETATEPPAAPSGGPAASVDHSNVTERPPSVS
jgi:[ribosomal protein S5]-alanine N-acetyltransferase